ncbi:MAG TPA: MFS transporter, partial [Chthoniobacterales bacterium]|nr:MFS transporter [Chthoniobacterales bacterium]
VISAVLTGRMVKRFGEKRTLYIGQFFGSAGMLMAGLAKTGTWLLASIPIMSLWNISMPAAQSMMTHRVSEREQGELQGALQSLRSITFIIGPILFFRVFGWFIDPKHPIQLPGAPFYLAAGLLFTAMLMSTRIRQQPLSERSTPPPEVPEIVPTEDIGGTPIVPREL